MEESNLEKLTRAHTELAFNILKTLNDVNTNMMHHMEYLTDEIKQLKFQVNSIFSDQKYFYEMQERRHQGEIDRLMMLFGAGNITPKFPKNETLFSKTASTKSGNSLAKTDSTVNTAPTGFTFGTSTCPIDNNASNSSKTNPSKSASFQPPGQSLVANKTPDNSNLFASNTNIGNKVTGSILGDSPKNSQPKSQPVVKNSQEKNDNNNELRKLVEAKTNKEEDLPKDEALLPKTGSTAKTVPLGFTFGTPTNQMDKNSPISNASKTLGAASLKPSGQTFASVASNSPANFSFLASNANVGNKAPGSLFGDSPKNFQIFQPRSQPVAKESPDKNDNDEAEEFVPDVYFEPVVPLPKLVDAKTGEEEEEVVFVSRCKLYRYDRGLKEQKERGVGEIKILKHNATGRTRCVMRRDQILNICANFPITSNMTISPKPNMPTIYNWHCKDFSQEDSPDGSDEVFTARFKEVAMAEDFAKKFRDAAN